MSASLDDRWRRNPSDAMTEQTFLHEVIQRLWRRKLLIVSLTILLFGMSFLGIATLPRSYQSQASVAVESQTPSAVQSGDVLRDTPFDDQTIGTEIAILGSRQLFIDTINATGLLSKPEFNPTIRRPGMIGTIITNLRATLETWWPEPVDDTVISPSDLAIAETIATLKKHIKLAPLTRSRVIEITATANNNKLAAQIANKIADLYILNHREYRQAAIREAHGFLDEKIGELRREAAEKTATVENYRVTHGLTMAMTATLVQEQVSKVSEQLGLAQARLADLEGRALSGKTSEPTATTPVLTSPTMSNLRAQEATLAIEQAKLAQSYGANSQMLGRVNAQLDSVRGQIRAEAARFRQSVPNDVTAAKANVAALTKAMAEIKAEAQKTEQARVHLATLQDDADTARKIYNDYLTRLRETDATVAYLATNVRVISYAAVPIRPSFPNYIIMVPSSFVLSGLIAALLAYWTTSVQGMVGRTDIENLFDGVRALGLIPLRTAATEQLFDTSIEQLLNRLIMMDEHPKSILITSPLPQQGKTTTARALAEAARKRGLQVFLVDADMRSAVVTKKNKASLPPSMGLGDVIMGDMTISSVARRTDEVPMLPAGRTRGNPTSLMAMPSMKKMLDRLSVENDLVIVDGPPVLIGGDCEMLCMTVETTVLLAKWPAKPETVSLALRELDRRKLAGMVLTMVDLGKMGRYGSSDAALYDKKLHRYYRR